MSFVHELRRLRAEHAELLRLARALTDLLGASAAPPSAVIEPVREELRGTSANGFGALVDRPDVIVKNMSEEHGLLDIAKSDWRWVMSPPWTMSQNCAPVMPWARATRATSGVGSVWR